MDERQLYIELGANIRAARERAKLDQATLADAVGLVRTSITNIERGRQRPQLHVIYAIADVLKVSISDILPRVGRVDKGSALGSLEIGSGLGQNELDWIKGLVRRASAGEQ